MKTGTTLEELAKACASLHRESRIIKGIVAGTTRPKRWQGYISAQYPVVTGFCGALNRMIGLFDPVRTNPRLFKSLHLQGIEEMGHNQLWRNMLELYNIDHVRLYETLLNYKADLGPMRWAGFGDEFIKQMRDQDTITGIYPEPPFPDPVLALVYLQEKMTSPGKNPWLYFAGQGAIEATILEVVTSDVYPGLAKNQDLNIGEASLAWWSQHIKENSSGRATAEVHHLENALSFLNENVHEGTSFQGAVTDSIVTTLTLFAATIKWHDHDTFHVSPYRTS